MTKLSPTDATMLAFASNATDVKSAIQRIMASLTPEGKEIAQRMVEQADHATANDKVISKKP